MHTQDYEKVSITQFKGLYQRGMADECPPDHAPCCQNVSLRKRGEVNMRGGTKISLPTNHHIIKQYLATFATPGLVLKMITLDDGGLSGGTGNLYDGLNPVPIFSLVGMYDFHLISVFGRVYILVKSTASVPNLLVWDGINPVRQAAGFAPTVTFAAADGAADLTKGLDIGVHQFAVCYFTNTGFTTPPGPKIAGVFTPVLYTAPGQKKVNLTLIPTGPSFVTQRIILATKANETEFFFVPGGTINDNTTTTLTLDFSDSELVISADYLFDLLEQIPTQDPPGTNAGMLSFYHGRLVVVVGRLVRVSRIDDVESMDNVVGFFNVPMQTAGNNAFAAFIQREVLYITQAIGVFAVQDNLGDPNTWPITIIDGALIGYKDSISTIASNIPALGISETTLLANREGLFVFDGVAQRPPLSWKIDNLWQTITHGAEIQIQLNIDVFNQVGWILLPVNGSRVPNLLLSFDFTEGLNFRDIKWSMHFFAQGFPLSLGMASFSDIDGLIDNDYYLRLSFAGDNNLYKMRPDLTDDNGSAINEVYQMYLATFEEGAINICSALRLRLRGPGTILLTLSGEDFVTTLNPVSFTAVVKNPGQELFRQVNFQNEKVSLTVATNAVGDKFTLNRADLFGKGLYRARPMIA